jgi:hypothetical protein
MEIDDYPPGQYTTATVCLRGHVLTADATLHPAAKPPASSEWSERPVQPLGQALWKISVEVASEAAKKSSSAIERPARTCG